ncbi:hypothetical protein ACFL6M_04105 [Candidatus Eisenbacteria bacterium]|uniref:Uncharacterized protein n=1 Tax=Eiseniibacteriota bacterium TaxID=2212470 RepID=A0ABV6YKA3_UNCEI
MPTLRFSRSTDTEHMIELESTLISAVWATRAVFAGGKAEALVQTSMVGDGAPVQLTAKDQSGRKIGKIGGQVWGNRFTAEVTISEKMKLGDEVYFEARLPKNGLIGTSNVVPVRLLPKLENLEWSAKEARRGDLVTLLADVENVPDHSEATLTIFEHDANGAHDRIAELRASAEGGRIRCEWEYEYHEDTDEIPTQEEMEKHGGKYSYPEYFFTVKVGGLELGTTVESGLLRFLDWVGFSAPAYDPGLPKATVELELPDGTKKSGQIDEAHLRFEDIPPGPLRTRIRVSRESDG